MGIVFNTHTLREPRFAFNAPPITYQDMEAPLKSHLDFNHALVEAKRALSGTVGILIVTTNQLEPEDQARLERLRCKYIPGWDGSEVQQAKLNQSK